MATPASRLEGSPNSGHGAPTTKPPEEEPGTQLVMPGDPARVAQQIQAISPEGKPADPKLGPGALGLIVLGFPVVVLGTALAIGIWHDWALGLAVAGLGFAGLMFNPVLAAALQRRRERADVLKKSSGRA